MEVGTGPIAAAPLDNECVTYLNKLLEADTILQHRRNEIHVWRLREIL